MSPVPPPRPETENLSQTQEESQVAMPPPQYMDLTGAFKRKKTDQEGPRKRVKISMGPAVDLGD
jgi:hypothetical protein